MPIEGGRQPDEETEDEAAVVVATERPKRPRKKKRRAGKADAEAKAAATKIDLELEMQGHELHTQVSATAHDPETQDRAGEESQATTAIGSQGEPLGDTQAEEPKGQRLPQSLGVGALSKLDRCT